MTEQEQLAECRANWEKTKPDAVFADYWLGWKAAVNRQVIPDGTRCGDLIVKNGTFVKFEDDGDCPDAQFIAAANPTAVLALIAESEALKGPHDWLAEDLIKELVDNAQSFQENSCEEGEDPFVIVLLAAASRIRRQEANLDQLKTENKRLVPFEEAYGTACNVRNRLIRENELLDQLIVHNKALSDSFRAERDQLKAENEALRKERKGKVLCDLELFETLRDSASTEADEHRQVMATYRPLRQANLDSVVKKCDDLLAAMGKGEKS